MWSLEFVEVADEEKQRQPKVVVERSISVSGTEQSPSKTGKSSSVSIPCGSSSVRLDTFKDPSLLKTQMTEYSSSVDSDTGHMVYAVQNWLNAEKGSSTQAVERYKCDEDSFNNTGRDDGNRDEIFVIDDVNSCKKTSSSTIDIGVDVAATMSDDSKTASRPVSASYVDSSPKQKSVDNDDSPTSGDYCFVTASDVKDAMPPFARTSSTSSVGSRRKLRDGFQWQKQLVFRSKLTMHTAFERKDNKDPAAVTALAVSRFVTLVSIQYK